MSSKQLVLVPYDPAWPRLFQEVAERITAAIGAHVLRVEHVGSTAVPNLLAKPVIDIGVAVSSMAAADACIPPLTSLGYQYRGIHGDDSTRRYYVLNQNGRRAVQIHVYITPSQAWDEMLRFRDALRADPELAESYAAEKRRVAESAEWNKGAYAVAKGPFVRRVLDALGA